MQLWLETLVETFDLDEDAVNTARALWRLRRIRKTQARLAYERFRRGSYSVVELPAPKYPPALPAPSRPTILSDRDVYAQLPRVDGFTWRVYTAAPNVGFHLLLRDDGYDRAIQATFPQHGPSEGLRLKADAMMLELQASRPKPDPAFGNDLIRRIQAK